MGDRCGRWPLHRRAAGRPAARRLGRRRQQEVPGTGDLRRQDRRRQGRHLESVTATPAAKAAVVLNIENPGFQDFRSDATCTIRPQALIGEKYVDCLPTQPRIEGTPPPPKLHKIPSGVEGEGQYYLPVTQTHSPVDVDLLGDISRLPERQRLTLIINELGAGLAGRGTDLNVVIRRANPALAELDKVLSILASENHVLTQLAVDSDKALAPLAAVREHVSNFIVSSNAVSQATAAQRGAPAQSLSLFPEFLVRPRRTPKWRAPPRPPRPAPPRSQSAGRPPAPPTTRRPPKAPRPAACFSTTCSGALTLHLAAVDLLLVDPAVDRRLGHPEPLGELSDPRA